MSRADVGKNLVRVRVLRMWTQDMVAREAGISPTTVSGVESGRISNPHFGTIRKLAHALDILPEELLSASGSEEAGEAKAQKAHPLSLEWAITAQENEFERALENATLERLVALARELEREHERLKTLYGEARGGEQRRSIKRRIRGISANSGSVNTSIQFHDAAVADSAHTP